MVHVDGRMKFVIAIIFIMLFVIVSFGKNYTCMPADIKEDTVVTFVTQTSTKGVETSIPVTVKQTLKKMKARCSHGKLLDRKGKQIRFYNLQGCWGTPPPGYQEILEKQRTDLEALKKKYTVIEMTCNASGMPLY